MTTFHPDGEADERVDLEAVPLIHRFPGLSVIADAPISDPWVGWAFHRAKAHRIPGHIVEAGISTVGELSFCTMADVRDWQGVGARKAQLLLDGLHMLESSAPDIVEIHREIEEEVARQLPARVPVGTPASWYDFHRDKDLALEGASLAELGLERFPAPHEEEDLSLVQLSEDRLPKVQAVDLGPSLELISQWAAFTRGAATWGAVAAAVTKPLPQDVADAVAKISDATVPASDPVQPLDLLEEWVDSLSERDRGILEGRIVRLQERTLQDLGDTFGVTRERIRQIQVTLEKELHKRLAKPLWKTVGWAVHALQTGLGSLAPLTEVPALNADVAQAREFRVLLWFAGYEWDFARGLLLRRGFQLPPRQNWPLLEDELRIDEEALRTQLQSDGVLEEWMDHALGVMPLLHRVNGQLVLWPGNIADKGAAVLAAIGRPMAPDDVADLVEGDFNRRGFKDRMFNHPQVMRTGKNEVALRCWGLEEYTGSINEMVKILEAEGPTPIAELSTRLAKQFDISATSIHLYAGAPLFVLEKGVVRLRTTEKYEPQNRPWLVPGLYRSSRGLVIWHVVTDHDILRGSGRKIPNEVALAVGVGVGSTSDFSGPDGPIAVRWALSSHVGASLGSIRSIAASVSAKEGDLLRIAFDPQRHTVSGSLVQADDPGSSAESRVANLTGLPPEDCLSAAALAEALFTTDSQVDSALRSRGSEALLDLVKALPPDA